MSRYNQLRDSESMANYCTTSATITEQKEKQNKCRFTISHRLIGVLFVLAFGLSYSFMGFIVKLNFQRNLYISAGDVLLVRSIGMLVVYLPIAIYYKINIFNIRSTAEVMLVFRCIFSALDLWCLFMAIMYLPTSVSFTIFNSNLLFVGVFGIWFIDTKIKFVNIMFTTICLIWAILIGISRNLKSDDNTSEIIGVSFALSAAIFRSIGNSFMHKIMQEVHWIITPIHIWVASIFLSLLLFCFNDHQVHSEQLAEPKQFMMISVVSILSLVCHGLLVMASKYSSESMIKLSLFITILVNFCIDKNYFEDEIYPLDVIAFLIIFSWVLWTIYKQFKRYDAFKLQVNKF